MFRKKRVRYVDEVKGIDARPVPATERLLDALKACRQLGATRLLHADDGRELTPKMVKLWVMRAERRAGLPETGRMHVYRHTFASHLAMAGVPAKTIQELARHRSFADTMRYMHLSPSAKDEASRCSSGRAKKEGVRWLSEPPRLGQRLGHLGSDTRKPLTWHDLRAMG